jgi:phytoene dehydrogenase-like protein
VTSRHYDVVALGRSLGTLAAAALLARRDFRVLLLGQGQKPPSYRFEQHLLRRRTFTLLVGSSPTWRRILHELAQSPRFRRRTHLLDPMFVVLAPGRRVEIAPDLELFEREVDREFPEVRQVVDELYATFAQANAAADAAFERDAMWPPGSFWERIETGRAASGLPFVGRESQQDLLYKFPAGHFYRLIALLPALFASNAAAPAEQHPPFALARLHGAWTRGVLALSRGEDELAEFLIQRVEAHGGECRLGQRASRIVVRRGAVAGIMEEGEEEPTGAGAVVCNLSGEAVANLAGGEGITKAARRDWPRMSATVGRFVVSLVVRTAGLPDALAAESFLLSSERGPADPRRPAIHLQRQSLEELGSPGHTLLVAEALLPTRGPLTLLEAREAVVAALGAHLPFLDEHTVVIDSPHDGLPLYHYVSGQRREIDRIHVTEGSPGPEPMDWQWTTDGPSYLDLGGEPVRGPIPGTYLVGKTVLPALGQESELLAAWSAARAITRSDRVRQKMRRQMWTKIETG